MISLRVSQDEFQRFSKTFRARGARSISEFARTAMQKVIADGGEVGGKSPVDVLAGLYELKERVDALDQQIYRLSAAVFGSSAER
jgi:hypothetical protein